MFGNCQYLSMLRSFLVFAFLVCQNRQNIQARLKLLVRNFTSTAIRGGTTKLSVQTFCRLSPAKVWDSKYIKMIILCYTVFICYNVTPYQVIANRHGLYMVILVLTLCWFFLHNIQTRPDSLSGGFGTGVSCGCVDLLLGPRGLRNRVSWICLHVYSMYMHVHI